MISAQDPTAFAFINGDGLDVTTSTISLHPGFASLLEFFEMVNSQDLEDIIWEQDRYLHVNLAAAGGAPLDWYTVTPTFGDPAFSPIAEAVPEPSSLTLLGIGIAGMAGYRLRRRKAAAAA